MAQSMHYEGKIKYCMHCRSTCYIVSNCKLVKEVEGHEKGTSNDWWKVKVASRKERNVGCKSIEGDISVNRF